MHDNTERRRKWMTQELTRHQLQERTDSRLCENYVRTGRLSLEEGNWLWKFIPQGYLWVNDKDEARSVITLGYIMALQNLLHRHLPELAREREFENQQNRLVSANGGFYKGVNSEARQAADAALLLLARAEIGGVWPHLDWPWTVGDYVPYCHIAQSF